jgi:hypothetical protein
MINAPAIIRVRAERPISYSTRQMSWQDCAVGLVEAAAEQELEMVFLGLVDERPVRLEGFGDGRHQPLGDEIFQSRSIAGLDDRPQALTARRFRLAEL